MDSSIIGATAMKLLRYVVRYDREVAPNYDLPAVTLAICKPRIRRGAAIGDLVLGFATASDRGRSRYEVVWAGVVSEKLDFADYWVDSRFQDKKPGGASLHPDNIYEPIGLELRQVENDNHGPDSEHTDKSGRYVLVMNPSWRFAAGQKEMPDSIKWRMDPFNRRGHRVDEIDNKEMKNLQEWLAI
jgi:hypothetical protein